MLWYVRELVIRNASMAMAMMTYIPKGQEDPPQQPTIDAQGATANGICSPLMPAYQLIVLEVGSIETLKDLHP